MIEADLRDVSDAKDEALRLIAIFEEYQTHPQRLCPLRAATEESLLRAFAGVLNQLRQQDLGIERVAVDLEPSGSEDPL